MSFGAGLVMWGVRDGDRSISDPAARPAFYALAPGGWRDLVTLLHPPYTAWHLSYVALGAAAAPRPRDRLVAALAAFFLAVGVSAHALTSSTAPAADPLSAGHADRARRLGLGGAVAIGIAGAADLARLLTVRRPGAFLVVAYNLELFGGRFHSESGSRWRGARSPRSPATRQCAAVRPAGLLVTAACCLLSVAQRRLSTPVRELRRRTAVIGEGTCPPPRHAAGPRATRDPLEGALSALGSRSCSSRWGWSRSAYRRGRSRSSPRRPCRWSPRR